MVVFLSDHVIDDTNSSFLVCQLGMLITRLDNF